MKIVFSAVWEHMRSERRAYVRETVNYSVFICYSDPCRDAGRVICDVLRGAP